MNMKCLDSSKFFATAIFQVSNYMLKVNNKNTRTKSKICSKLTLKTTQRCQMRRSRVLIVNSETILHLALLFLLLTLSS